MNESQTIFMRIYRIYDYEEDVNSIDDEFKDHAKVIKNVFRDPKLLKLNVDEVVEKEELASPRKHL